MAFHFLTGKCDNLFVSLAKSQEKLFCLKRATETETKQLINILDKRPPLKKQIKPFDVKQVQFCETLASSLVLSPLEKGPKLNLKTTCLNEKFFFTVINKMKCRESSLTSVSAVGGDDTQREPEVGIPVLEQKSYTVSKLGRRC